MYASLIIKFLLICAVDGFSSGRYNNRNISGDRGFIMKSLPCEYGMCEYIEGYPTKTIFKLLKNLQNFEYLFGNVVEPYTEIGVNSRFNDIGVGVCGVKTVRKRPRILKDINGNERIIVNVDGASQTVLFEVCERPQYECFNYGIIKSYKCTQKFTAIGLLTVKDEKSFEIERFPIPSTCVCALQFI